MYASGIKDHDVDVVEPAQLFTTKILLFLQIATRIALPLFCKKHSIDCIKTELALSYHKIIVHTYHKIFKKFWLTTNTVSSPTLPKHGKNKRRHG
jgi:hypothetical protein